MKNLLCFVGAFVLFGTLMLNCNKAQAESLSIADAQQVQNQTQGQSTDLQNIGNSAVSFNGSFNGSDPIRNLPIPQAAAYDTRGGPALFGRPNYNDGGPNFMSMNELVGVLNNIDLDTATIADEGDIEVVAQMLNALRDDDATMGTAASSPGQGGVDEKIKFMLNLNKADVMKDRVNFRPMAIVTLKANDNNTMNSATLAVKLAIFAKKIKANKIILVNEGVVKRLSSFGVGIGFASNYASVGSDGNDVGSTGAGGTGWSWGESEFFSLPYLTAVVGRD